jgi:hypothetical protein
MPDSNPTPPNAWEGMELAALNLLTDPCRQPTLWAMADIGRELDYHDPDAVIFPLHRAGLVHKTSDGYVFATPAAFHLTSLVGHIV